MSDREQIAEFIFNVVVEVDDLTRQNLLDDYGIDIGEYPLWAKLLPNTREKYYKRASELLALLKEEGYVKLAKDQTVSADGGWYIPRDFRRVELESK